METKVALSMFISALGAVALTSQNLSQARAAMIFLGMALFVGLTISSGRSTPILRALICAVFPSAALAGVLYVLTKLYGLAIISGITLPVDSSLKLQLIATIGALAVFGNLVCIVMSPALAGYVQSILRINTATMTRSTMLLQWIIAILLLVGSIATVVSTGETPPKGVPTINPVNPH
jgi:hypothetical protein